MPLIVGTTTPLSRNDGAHQWMESGIWESADWFTGTTIHLSWVQPRPR